MRARREADVATRRRPITGLSEFANLADPVPAPAQPRPTAGAPRSRRCAATRRPPTSSWPRWARSRPTPPAPGSPPTCWQPGGIGIDVAGATGGVDDLVAAYSGQAVVCLAGTDAAYAEWGREAAEALRAAGATRVVVAGKPAEWADDSCALGVDAIEFLTRTREAL